MDQEKRPGGLTALAVLNFVFAGLGFLSLLVMGAFFALIGLIPTEDMPDKERMQIEALQDMGTSTLALVFALSLVSVVLLLLSVLGSFPRATELL